MSPPYTSSEENEEAHIRDTAERWVVRQDRKLSRAETVELEAWLAADARHAAEFENSVTAWRKVRQMGAAFRRVDAAARVRRARRNRMIATGIAAAAAVLLFSANWRSKKVSAEHQVASSVATDPAAPITRNLSDGSTARLRAGAEMVEEFSTSERRVQLVRGEVFFGVVKDEARPFLVQVGGATVRAIGTAFSVEARREAVNVLVTEGTVRVTAPVAAPGEPLPASELVAAGHRAVVTRTAKSRASPIAVTTVSPPEMARELAWCGQMLELGGATLSELAAAFGERSGRRIIISDASLATIRIGGQFPTDDVEGFIRAIETAYAIKAEHRPDGSVVLSAQAPR